MTRPFLERERVVLVEGPDDQRFIEAMLKRFHAAERDVQVHAVGGVDRIRSAIGAIRSQSKLHGLPLRAIGIVRDADLDAAASLTRVTDAITAADYRPPADHGAFSDGDPRVGVFILPDGRSPGALETLCRRSFADRPGAPSEQEAAGAGRERDERAAGCAERYLDCLRQNDARLSQNEDKSFVHAFLASRRNPVARVGESALQGVWDFTRPAFEPLNRFIRELLGRE